MSDTTDTGWWLLLPTPLWFLTELQQPQSLARKTLSLPCQM